MKKGNTTVSTTSSVTASAWGLLSHVLPPRTPIIFCWWCACVIGWWLALKIRAHCCDALVCSRTESPSHIHFPFDFFENDFARTTNNSEILLGVWRIVGQIYRENRREGESRTSRSKRVELYARLSLLFFFIRNDGLREGSPA